ncbi:hypothetical protein [Endozoicomonas sp. GU-1]|uniref:hypothetical protein n=1 Tax=Endozoicomonas sp. GU-1 TaxID=3009078 RepID=UPI0022B309A4|nr:hypothetical protein [Endozoicomonas sp. GU-1]WBA83864.1 hypothetical protein O2T12_12455 [Endozoicomonas sp. GU-1]WBA86842.1 hypothetical protein O3276_02010 [Endozoicomonas sp. GU-1]
MIEPSVESRVGTAGERQPVTTMSLEPQGRWGSLAVFRESGVEPLLPDNTPDKILINDNDEDNNPSLHRRQPASLARTGQPLDAAVVPGGLSGLATAGMAVTGNRNNDPWIAVADAETLGKIGHDPDYPLNGNYQQTVAYIDGGQSRQSIGNDTHPFTGILRGNEEKRTIGNLRNCLVKTLAGEGRVDSLRFTGANITSTGATGVVACKISDQATVSNICVDNARVVALGKKAIGGIIGGDVSGTVVNTMAVNSNVQAHSSRSRFRFSAKAGIGAGRLTGGMVVNTTAVNCTVAASAGGGAGIGAGHLDGHGIIANTTAVNCKVVTPDYGNAGIGVGYLRVGTLANTTALNCKVVTRSGGSGIGAGWLDHHICRVSNTTAVNCQVENAGADLSGFSGIGSAGIGAGMANVFDTVADTTAVNCQVVTSGENGDSGIGVGRASVAGAVVDTTAVNSTVVASGQGGRAGIGAGRVLLDLATVANTTAVNCHVKSTGSGGGAGVGAGLIRHSTVSETIANTTALNCTVLASGKEATAGIGVGDIDSGGTVVSTTAINCQVDSLGEYSTAAVRGGPEPDICNVHVHGREQNNTDNDCRSEQDKLCAGLNHRLLTTDCQFNDDFVGLIRSNTRRLCPVTPTIIPSASSNRSPSTSGLSNGVIVGIAFGGVLFVLVGIGFCLYRYYCHRGSSRAAGKHYEPLMARGRRDISLTMDGSNNSQRSRRGAGNISAPTDNERMPLIPRT